MKIIEGNFQTVDVKDTQYRQKLYDDCKDLKVFVLDKFVYLALFDFFPKILFETGFANAEIFDLILGI